MSFIMNLVITTIFPFYPFMVRCVHENRTNRHVMRINVVEHFAYRAQRRVNVQSSFDEHWIRQARARSRQYGAQAAQARTRASVKLVLFTF